MSSSLLPIRHSGVSVAPGPKQLMRTPVSFSSSETARVKPMIPALEAE